MSSLVKKPLMDCYDVGVAISSGGGGMFNLLGCCCDPSTHASIFRLEHVEVPASTHVSLFLLHVKVPALKPKPKDDSVTHCSHRLFCLCFSLFECDFSALSPILETSIVRSHHWHNAFRLSAFSALTQALYWGSRSNFLLYKHWPFRPFDSMTQQNSLCMRWLTRAITNCRG